MQDEKKVETLHTTFEKNKPKEPTTVSSVVDKVKEAQAHLEGGGPPLLKPKKNPGATESPYTSTGFATDKK